MNVALDIDDTITRHPEFFALLSRALRAEGHRVLVITFREERAPTERDLRGWGVEYDELITCSLEATMEHGVDRWKAVVCEERGVDVFFEDDAESLAHVAPSVLCLRPMPTAESSAAADSDLVR